MGKLLREIVVFRVGWQDDDALLARGEAVSGGWRLTDGWGWESRGSYDELRVLFPFSCEKRTILALKKDVSGRERSLRELINI